MRRSSTARSIGARSDFDLDVDLDSDGENESSVIHRAIRLSDPKRDIARKEADDHINRYIEDQLERVRSNSIHDGVENGDEFEATP